MKSVRERLKEMDEIRQRNEARLIGAGLKARSSDKSAALMPQDEAEKDAKSAEECKLKRENT